MSGANLLLWLSGAAGGGGGGDSVCYTSGTDTITAPAGKTGVTIKMWGAGGAGGSRIGGFGGGGGGGAYVVKTMAVTGGVTQFTYTVAAQTLITAYGNNNGQTGGSSTITGGASLTAGGGSGGQSSGIGGAGGTATGGDAGSENGAAGSSNVGGNAGGQSQGGGQGGTESSAPGTAPGGGGAGGQDDAGGRGARGEVCFYWLTNNINLSNQSVRSWGYNNSQGICEFKLGSDGVAYIADEIGVLNPIAGEWLVSGTSSDYEVKATQNLTTGVPPGTVSGTFGSWQSLGTDRSWYVEVTNGGIGVLNATLFMTIEIRDAVSLSVLATANVTLWASSTDSSPP